MLSKNNSISINGVNIDILLEDGTRYVAIKPICNAIGIKYDTQIDKINSDEILNELTPLRGSTGTDGKTYKMRVIPLRFVFGWLFTINSNNVKPEIKDRIIKYKLECYNALFDFFSKRTSIIKERADYLYEIHEIEQRLHENEDMKLLKQLKDKMKDTTKRLNSLDRIEMDNQLSLFHHQ